MAADPLRGRVLAVADDGRVRVVNEAGGEEILVSGARPAVGDVVEIARATGVCRVLTPNRAGGRTAVAASVLDPRRRRGVAVRERVTAGVRAFFAARGFHETQTPVRVVCPGMEPHIKPVPAGEGHWLQTSPEFAMKRLLVGGLERVFQLAPVFRDEPRAPAHRSEFTMLEWYRAHADETAIMSDSEALVAELATAIHGSPRISFAGRTIDLTPPWPRRRVRELFLEHAGVDLAHASPGALGAACLAHGLLPSASDDRDDLYFRLWLDVVEPRLPADRPIFVTHYPASQAALAVVTPDADGTPWARRFEIYAGGLELGNAFYELTDPAVQRRRFTDDMALRARVHAGAIPVVPADEAFLAALDEGLPPSAGIAIGLDRLVMLLADEPDIGFTRWLD